MTYTKKFKTPFSLLCISKYKGLCVDRRYKFIAYYPKTHQVKVINAQGRAFVYKAEHFRLWEKVRKNKVAHGGRAQPQ